MPGSRRSNISPREADVLDLVAAGHGNKEIGAALGIADSTVKCHIVRIMRRLGLPNRTAVAVWWVRQNQPEATRIECSCPRCGAALRVLMALR